MANLTTIARPYARAVMSLAKENNSYAQWTKMLEFLSKVVTNKIADKFIRNLAIASEDKAKFINSLAPGMLDQHGQNLVKTLAYYKRLPIIPALYVLYEEMRKVEQREITVKLFVAHELAADELATIRQEFSAELGSNLNLHHEFEPGLIGGGKVKIGDRVLDASIKSSLKELYKHLTIDQGHLA